MTILVTGGAGFIGSHVCDRLLEGGENVICVDNFDPYYNPHAKKRNINSAISHPNFTLSVADIRSFEELKAVFRKNEISKVVHLAAKAGVRHSIENPHVYEEVNVKGTLNLLKLSEAHEIESFVFGSSSSVYGNTTDVPFSEKNTATDRPASPYAATKKMGELLCHTYHHLSGMNATCLRFFTVYGPRGRPDMAPYIFTDCIYNGKQIEAYGNGTSRRDYTYVDDIVDGIVLALEKSFGYEVVNLGNSRTVTLRDFISVVENAVGRRANIQWLPEQSGDVTVTHADISKAKKLLGWRPRMDVKEGMKCFVDWYEQHVAREGARTAIQ